MKVQEDAARRMFGAAGLPVEKWPVRRLLVKLQNIVEVMSSAPKEVSGEDKRLMLKVAEAIMEKEPLELDSTLVDVNTKREDTQKEKGAGEMSKENGKTHVNGESEKPQVLVDGFGSKLGTTMEQFNKVLSAKSKKMRELMEEAKVTETHYLHARKLIEKGFVEKTDEGYRLTPSGKAAQKAKPRPQEKRTRKPREKVAAE